MTRTNRTTADRSILRYSAPLCVGVLALGTLGGCDGPESVVATEENTQPSDASAQAPETTNPPTSDGVDLSSTVTVEGIRIAIPDRWRPATTAATFTAVQYTVPSPDGDADQNATFTISTPIGGGLMYNLLRWDRQFRGDDASTSTWITVDADQQTVHFVGQGPLDTGRPGSTGVQEDTMVLGAIPIVNGPEQVELGEPDDAGRYEFAVDESSQPMRLSNVFIKLTGPASVVDHARAEWDAMLQSIEIRDVSHWATP